MPGPVRFLLPLALAAAPMGAGFAQAPRAARTPEALGFQHYYKCPSDADVDRLGDTRTPEACRAACKARKGAAGCWWLDGSGGFPRECRVCRTRPPVKGPWPNDWGLPLADIYTS